MTAEENSAYLRERGLERHRGGDLAEARRLYLQAIAQTPSDAASLNLLGVIAQQQGNAQESVDWLSKALAFQPTAGTYANLANALYLLGRLTESEEACRSALALDPDLVDAWQNLGNALWAQGRASLAVEAYRQAHAKAPDRYEVERSLGLVLLEEGVLEEALSRLEAVNRRRPNDLAAILGRGTALHRLGRYSLAVDLYRQVLAQAPNDVVAIERLAAALRSLGRNREAAEAYDRVSRLNPSKLEAQIMLAGILVELGDYERAIPLCRRIIINDPACAEGRLALAIALTNTGDPGSAILELKALLAERSESAAAWRTLGLAFRKTGKLTEAAQAYRKAATFDPNSASTLGVLAGVLKDAGLLGLAIATAVQALRLDPACVDALVNMGAAKIDQGRLHEGVADLEAALKVDPGQGAAWCNLAIGLGRQGKLDEALSAYERGLSLEDNEHHRLGYAFALLKKGRFKEGWIAHEARLAVHPGYQTPVSLPPGARWQGEKLEGGRLIIQAEQGLGDTIQCLRFASWAAARAGRAVIQAPEPLLKLCRRIKGIEAAEVEIEPEAGDRRCAIFSLPGLYGVDAERLPGEPYLDVEPEAIEHWKRRLGEGPFRVGLVWQGNPSAPVERGRSTPLADFAPFFTLSGVEMVSLQRDYGLDQFENLPPWMNLRSLGADFDAGDLHETAAILQSIDLVVACDTALAHLAGALGRPTWLMVNAVSDWRWMERRVDTPWYPSMRLYRQERPGLWREPIERAARDLAKICAIRAMEAAVRRA